jgi:hypothetical protein
VGRNEIVFVLRLVLVLDSSVSDCENEDDDEDERLAASDDLDSRRGSPSKHLVPHQWSKESCQKAQF